MGHYSMEDDTNDMSVDEDIDSMFRNPPEVTEGFFSRCEKKKEETKKVCGCASEDKKKEKKKSCECKEKASKMSKRSRSRSSARRSKRALNAFIIFYLEMYAKSPNQHVTCVAKKAGKKWCSMSKQEKEKYIKMANARKEEKKEVKKC